MKVNSSTKYNITTCITKKIPLLCITFLTFAGSMLAQEISPTTPTWCSEKPTSSLENSLLDHDTNITIECHSTYISRYINPSIHHHPLKDRIVFNSRTEDHICNYDNTQAKKVYTERLNKLHGFALQHSRPSEEIAKIIYNFELLTGYRNGLPSKDNFGEVYIHSDTLQRWKLWFDRNKENIYFCPRERVIFYKPKESPKKKLNF